MARYLTAVPNVASHLAEQTMVRDHAVPCISCLAVERDLAKHGTGPFLIGHGILPGEARDISRATSCGFATTLHSKQYVDVQLAVV